jgi:uncharacterized damage-inducible protein DinB
VIAARAEVRLAPERERSRQNWEIVVSAEVDRAFPVFGEVSVDVGAISRAGAGAGNLVDMVASRWHDLAMIKSNDVTRVDPPPTGSERELLTAFLDFHRETLLMKCADLSFEQLKTHSVAPSTLSLLGLLRHMAEVERSWLRIRVAGEDIPPSHYWTDEDPDGDFDNLDSTPLDEVLANYHDEVAHARRILAETDLESTFTHPRHGDMSVRWVVIHMIEEYARHNGHADLLRQRIDGATGE